MTLQTITARLRRVLRKPPSHIARRLLTEVDHGLARFTQPAFGRRFKTRELLARTGASDINSLWNRVLDRPIWVLPVVPQRSEYEALVPGDAQRIQADAQQAVAHRIDLLGSGPVELGSTIDWHRDYKTGDRWPLDYFRRIDYINRDRSSDVKTVWELSRLQWLLPCGQAFCLTGDERFASAARNVIEQWIEGNPYALGVNWGVTMEAALRILSWTWLLKACGRSKAWADERYRGRFLSALYLHGVFTEKFFERSDVNGNHFTADAAGLVVIGALFGTGADAPRWCRSGVADLEHDIALQVYPDGVDFEASTAYHRFVAELFLVGAMAAQANGDRVSEVYRGRLAGMARFTAAYMRPDEVAPLWGDNDDARALSFGGQSLRDHRYLAGLIGLFLNDPAVIALAHGPRSEAAWWFGVPEATRLPEQGANQPSQGFVNGGVYIMTDDRNHVFIDCGPFGLAGRGGHGHNDLLSFEAFLDGVPLVTEAGCYVYTADNESRDRDRSSFSHNTPVVDGAEINRFLGPEYRWTMHNDAEHELVEFLASPEADRFVGRHTGYHRLPGRVTVERTIELTHVTSSLRISDRFIGQGKHDVLVPLHLSPGIAIQVTTPGTVVLERGSVLFEVRWPSTLWALKVDKGREAASYGCQRPIVRLAWQRTGSLEPLDVAIAPISRRALAR